MPAVAPQGRQLHERCTKDLDWCALAVMHSRPTIAQSVSIRRQC